MTEEKELSLFGGPAKNFVLPYILLLLHEMPVHGYEIIRKLSLFGFQTVDNGNIYRLLRKLEKDDLVHSEWDASSSGPAKRLYSLTEAGEAYLKLYAGELGKYQSMLDQFFKMYTNVLNLYIPGYASKEVGHLDNNKRRKEH